MSAEIVVKTLCATGVNGSVKNVKKVDEGFIDSKFPVPAQDMVEERNNPDFGICDECGEYAKSLVLHDGEWVCESCERFR